MTFFPLVGRQTMSTFLNEEVSVFCMYKWTPWKTATACSCSPRPSDVQCNDKGTKRSSLSRRVRVHSFVKKQNKTKTTYTVYFLSCNGLCTLGITGWADGLKTHCPDRLTMTGCSNTVTPIKQSVLNYMHDCDSLIDAVQPKTWWAWLVTRWPVHPPPFPSSTLNLVRTSSIYILPGVHCTCLSQGELTTS